jgi:hypothetical protein
MSAELFFAVAAAVERAQFPNGKTDRLGMGHKLPRLKSGVPAGGFRRASLCASPDGAAALYPLEAVDGPRSDIYRLLDGGLTRIEGRPAAAKLATRDD